MKQLVKIVFAYMKTNRLRTALTLFGIVLSVILISGVLLFQEAYTTYSKQSAKSNGTALIYYPMENEAEGKQVERYFDITDRVYTTPLYVTPLHEKAYISIVGYTDFNDLKLVSLADGTYPQNENELLIDYRYAKEHDLSLQDTLTLSVGSRLAGEKDVSMETRILADEHFVEAERKSFTIVGITAAQPTRGDDEAITMEFYTRSLAVNASSTAYVGVQDMTYEQWESRLHDLEERYLTAFLNEGNAEFYLPTPSLSLAEIVGYGLILLILSLNTIVLIRHMFSITWKERMRYYGILSCVGMTPKQLIVMNMVEAGIYGIVALPMGIVLAVALLSVYFSYMNQNALENMGVPLFAMHISGLHMLIICILVFMILYISSYASLSVFKKAAPIELVREQTVMKKLPKYHRHVFWERMFGIAAMIGKRNRRIYRKAYRSTKLSLFLSVLLFLTGNHIVSLALDSLLYTPFEDAYIVSAYTDVVPEELSDHMTQMEALRQLSEKDSLTMYETQLNVCLSENDVNKEILSLVDDIEDIYMDIRIVYRSDQQPADNDEFLLVDTVNVWQRGTSKLQQATSWQNGDLISLSSLIKMPMTSLRLYLQDRVDGTKWEEKAPVFDSSAGVPTLSLTILVTKDTFQQLYEAQYTQENTLFAAKTIFLRQDPDFLPVLQAYQQKHSTFVTGITDPYQPSDTEEVMEPFRLLCNGISLLLLFVCIANITHTMLSSIIARKKEDAVLEAIGSTPKQLFGMLLFETAGMLLGILLLAIVVSLICNYLLTVFLFPGMTYHVYVGQIVSIALIVVCVGLSISGYAWHFMNRRSLMERIHDDR